MSRHKYKRDHARQLRALGAAIITLGLAVSGAATATLQARADTGIDVASYQRCWDGAKAKAAGVNYAFVKLTEGTSYINPYATCQINTMRANGIREGAYDFARPQSNMPEAEADYFMAQAKSRGMIGKAIPVLDWEPSAPGGYWAKQSWWVARWVERIKATWGVTPMVYMSAANIKTTDWSQVVATNAGLWVAGYPRGFAADRLRNPGGVPYDVSPWPFAAAWQYSSSGSVAGISGRVDINWFYGDALTWTKYAGANTSTVPTTAPAPAKNNTTSGAPVADTETLATAVIRGEYGNNPQRRTLLGNRYDEVMAIVNRRLGGGTTAARPAPYGGGYCVLVQRGDTMSAIANRTGRKPVSAWSVPSGNINRIYPGNTVCYQGRVSYNPSPRGYRVKPGDTLSSIAARLGVNTSQIRGYRSGNPNLIYPGEVLTY